MAGKAPNRDEAERLAVEALSFIAGDAALLPRFLSLTGIEIGSLRQAASEPGFMAGVLQFILAHEPTLMQFCEATDTPPAAVGAAARVLPLGDTDYQQSI